MNALPHFAVGEIVKGFGRGSKQLGIPTANFTKEVVDSLPASLETGVYYGFAKVESDTEVRKMVMSIGWNPYFKNEQKSMETHVMHKYDGDLYGKMLKVVILGFIRPQLDFNSLAELITAIDSDISRAHDLLDKPDVQKYKTDAFFTSEP